MNKAKKLISESIVVDSALGFEPEIEVTHKWDLLARHKKSGFTFVGLAIAGEFTSLENTMHYMGRTRARIEVESDKYLIAQTADDILRAKREEKLALGFWLQGSAPLGGDLNMIQAYYRLGIRYMLLCYNARNNIGDGCIEPHDAGLSLFGIKVVEEMNRIGMLVDASHAGHHTTMDILNTSKAPIIFSHSNVHALVQHPRNLKDDQIIALAKNKGVIGVTGLALLQGKEKSSIEAIADHLEYICDLVGHEHVGLGLDMVYFHEILDLFLIKAGLTSYPPGYLGSMDSTTPEDLQMLVEILLKRNFTDEMIKAIIGGNFLRVAKQVWKK